MDSVYIQRSFLCIDLKSFFASCECLQRGLNPFTYPLVVANPEQGSGAITLAITPYLKNMGLKSRGRLYEIPSSIKYDIAKPHMNLYISKSKEVVKVYLKYVAEEDLHIYSIDECFLDVTDYLKLYKKTDYELALDILKDIYKTTGLFATAGVGPNMLLAKVSMDIEAKHNKNFIAKWTYQDIETKLWPITPLSKLWGIGPRMEKKLNKLNIYTVGDLASYDRNKLKQKYGVMGLELWNHANGIDLSRIGDFTKEREKSYSHSQVLMKDYNANNIGIIIREMVEVITLRLRANKKVCKGVSFGIGYSKIIGGGFYHSIKLENATDSEEIILNTCFLIFDKFYEDLPIRKVSISAVGLQDKIGIQLDIFNTIEQVEQEDKINEIVDDIKNKFGKNAILKASSLLEDSTIKQRNTKIGGHSA